MRAFGEVADALSGLAAAEAELSLRNEALTLAEENLRLARRAYELGQGACPMFWTRNARQTWRGVRVRRRGGEIASRS
ncbi:MAG: hypothetical protein IPG56_19120 [Caulobacteraceae bacterium]|nr:hypothetical protein [Caulobacteraceae bacterium]